MLSLVSLVVLSRIMLCDSALPNRLLMCYGLAYEFIHLLTITNRLCTVPTQNPHIYTLLAIVSMLRDTKLDSL